MLVGLVRLDAATGVMLALVGTLGLVILRFSGTYLQGDPGLARYRGWLLATLAAVAVLVLSNHLLLIAAAWTATSLALHQLLTFRAERPAAQVAAHKKFLVSRLADVCLLGALALVQLDVGSLQLDAIAEWVGARAELPLTLELAAALLVTAVALRSAQLPFHGWLTQVMEAPTPVSALLHAGVVNIGGFVLIRLAPWLDHAPLARLLLLLIGLGSAVVAALVMTTRVSVKVALAWSTCAQMGFMLVQCALGLWSLALLHLVAHSLYKAYAFLGAGSVVSQWRVRSLAPRPAPPSLLRSTVTALMAAGCAALAVATLGSLDRAAFHGPADVGLALLLGLSLAPLLAAPAPAGARAHLATGARVLAVALLYVGGHLVAERLVPPSGASASALAWGLAGAAFLGLFALKAALQARPAGALARRLYPWLSAGLYLDEAFTRVAFRLWPPRLPQPQALATTVAPPATLEVRA